MKQGDIDDPFSTDAVNGSQLYATNQLINKINNSSAIKFFNVNSTLGDSNALGADSMSIGPLANANGANSIAIGVNSSVSNLGAGAVAIGQNSEATNVGAIAIGQNSSSQGVGSIAIGSGALATGSVAVVLEHRRVMVARPLAIMQLHWLLNKVPQ